MNTNPAGYTYLDYLMHSDDELYHFGIKGMKWGVRRGRRASGGSRRAPLTPEQRAERNRKLKKAGKIALQTAGAAYLASRLAKGYRNGMNNAGMMERMYGPAAGKAGRRGAIAGTAVAGAMLAGGAAALHKSEKLRQQSMREKDNNKATKLRKSSRRWAVAGGLVGNPLATATYGVYRASDKERRRKNPEKYRAMGYVRN